MRLELDCHRIRCRVCQVRCIKNRRTHRTGVTGLFVQIESADLVASVLSDQGPTINASNPGDLRNEFLILARRADL
jgi:hypothetical protein